MFLKSAKLFTKLIPEVTSGECVACGVGLGTGGGPERRVYFIPNIEANALL